MTGVFVLGMHRSGTSAVAGTLARMGLTPGKHDFAPSPDNAKGYYESAPLADINEGLLNILGGTWYEPPEKYVWKWLPNHYEESLRTFHEEFPEEPWMWKDPRLCLLLPYWLSILEGDFRAVVVRRPQREVAASLKARDGMSLAAARRLCTTYWQAINRNLTLPHTEVKYADLLAQPQETAERMAAFLGLPAPDMGEIHAFLSPDLRHHGRAA